MNLSSRTKLLFVLLLLPLVLGLLTGCSTTSNVTSGGMNMASIDGMPQEVKSAPTDVQQAYRYAAANPEVLKQIPCYCGCVDLGHISNYDCYVSSVEANGTITYDDHATGCSICVDITQDVVRLSKLGKPITEIKTYIDQTYSQYGPANIP